MVGRERSFATASPRLCHLAVSVIMSGCRLPVGAGKFAVDLLLMVGWEVSYATGGPRVRHRPLVLKLTALKDSLSALDDRTDDRTVGYS